VIGLKREHVKGPTGPTRALVGDAYAASFPSRTRVPREVIIGIAMHAFMVYEAATDCY